MNVDPSDALARVEHVRSRWASYHHDLQQYDLAAHVKHGVPISEAALHDVRELLDQEVRAARDFADAVVDLRQAL